MNFSNAHRRAQSLVSIVCVSAFTVFVAVPSHAVTLEDVIQKVLTENPAVQAARQQASASEKGIKVAKSGYLPRLDLELGVGHEETLSPTTGDETVSLTREEAALRLSQTIYDGSAVKNKVAIQKERFNSASHVAVDTQENTALRAAQSYFNVLRQAENVALLQESLDEHTAIQEQMSLRNDAGVGSEADLNQVNVRLSLSTNSFIVGKNKFLNAVSQFNGLVGYIPDEKTMEVPENFSLPASLDEALALSLDQHPAIKAAQADIELAKLDQAVAKSANHPTLTLEGERKWNNDIDGIEGRNEDWVIALRFRYNIFNGGKDSARQKQTGNLLQQATETHKLILWQTEEGMRLSWYAYEATKQQLKHLRVHVESAIATKKAYDEQYKVGRRTLIEVLNAQNELTRAKQSYLNAKYDQLYSQVRVLNSSGQLTQALGIQ